MNRPNNQDVLIEDVKASQRNTLWPDAMVNSSSVDALILKGSAKATQVQRVGIAIWGLTFVCLGVVFECVAFEKGEAFSVFIGLLFLALGTTVFLNAFKRRHSPEQDIS